MPNHATQPPHFGSDFSHLLSSPVISLRNYWDPRRSLVAGLIWLVVALAASFAIAASLWVGRIAREIVVQQHVRRLVLETEQLGSDLGQAISMRLTAVRSVESVPPEAAFRSLASTYPDLGWIALADGTGVVSAANGSMPLGKSVAASPWFLLAANHPWLGMIEPPPDGERTAALGDIAIPLHDAAGRTVAVVAAHLTWPWLTRDLERLSASLDPRGSAQTLLLDDRSVVRVGPNELLNRPWNAVAIEDAPRIGPAPTAEGTRSVHAPRFERLPSGSAVLAARAPLIVDRSDRFAGWQVQLSEPEEQVYRRADALRERILWISLCLGAATALIGALAARHLTERLRRLTRSAVAVGTHEFARIEVPRGRDEVAQLAAAFAKVLDDLRAERSELLAMSTELERRVAVRTREVERLAEESRYAAIVRERLKIARDLHDTLAHSMMAMLSEVRLLRKLQVHDPASLVEELARAEEVAHEGLNEARNAITQMRVNAVRDTGLGAALAKAFDRFVDHTGLTGEFTAQPEAARFGDERAETLFRMAEEALRNVERHAMATHVSVALDTSEGTDLTLRIADDGIGFDTKLPRPGHYGLVGLSEMAQLIGADLRIDSAPNQGTTVSVTLRIVPEML
jgi:signal transduction histidine kinase